MAKKKASDLIRQGAGPGQVRAMVQLGLYEDDCGVLDDAPPLPDLSRPAAARPAPAVPDKVVYLPVWPDAVRGVPNLALRSALFGVIRRGPRRAMMREVIPCTSDFEIRYTGFRLDQADLDVWETGLHLARQHPMGNRVEITERALLKALGRSYGKSGREWLKNCAARLSANTLEVTHQRFTYGGSLLQDFCRDDDTGRYVLILNPKMVVIFGMDTFTLVDWDIRQELIGQPLAQWLHGFYASHAKPFPVSISKLHEWCGSENQDLYGFKRDVKAALELVAVASEKHGIEFKSEIREDLVHVERQPSKSQRKHLAGKAKKPERRNGMASVGDILKPKQK